MSSVAVTVVVVAGGRASRFGSDKLAATLHGTPLLDHLLGSLPEEWPVVAVGSPRVTPRRVAWTRENPPGGGPLAAIAAGMEHVATELVAVLAGDMPYAGRAVGALVEALHAAPDEVEAAVGTDDDGVANPLLAVYRTRAVQTLLPDPAHGLPAKTLLRLTHVTVTVAGAASRDVDTPADLSALAADPHRPGRG
jgi:molybdopterin-guanine dinucleotide biosynthesis protein A